MRNSRAGKACRAAVAVKPEQKMKTKLGFDDNKEK
jgi:hypothetical protein